MNFIGGVGIDKNFLRTHTDGELAQIMSYCMKEQFSINYELCIDYLIIFFKDFMRLAHLLSLPFFNLITNAWNEVIHKWLSLKVVVLLCVRKQS